MDEIHTTKPNIDKVNQKYVKTLIHIILMGYLITTRKTKTNPLPQALLALSSSSLFEVIYNTNSGLALLPLIKFYSSEAI